MRKSASFEPPQRKGNEKIKNIYGVNSSIRKIMIVSTPPLENCFNNSDSGLLDQLEKSLMLPGTERLPQGKP